MEREQLLQKLERLRERERQLESERMRLMEEERQRLEEAQKRMLEIFRENEERRNN